MTPDHTEKIGSAKQRRMLADPRHWIGLAWIDGGAVGIVTVTTMLYIEWGRLGEIGDLYVIPAARRKGIASALIEAAKSKCGDLGCSAVSAVITREGDCPVWAYNFLRTLRLRSVESEDIDVQARGMTASVIRFKCQGRDSTRLRRAGTSPPAIQ